MAPATRSGVIGVIIRGVFTSKGVKDRDGKRSEFRGELRGMHGKILEILKMEMLRKELCKICDGAMGPGPAR